MKEDFSDIRAYRVGAILAVTDWLTIFPYLKYLEKKTTDSLRLDYLGDRRQIEQDIKHGAFFITNHRDIIMDAAWLSFMLRKRYFIRPFMGIGDNLFAKRWIEWTVRFLRCFVVKRNIGAHAQLENSRHLSAYIRHLREQGKSIWLAQREGRAKDSNDLTQSSVIKMLTMGTDDLYEAVKALNFCPVSITYQYDPCDYLKAREMQLKRDNPRWHKTKRDDVESMVTGINGRKGHVVYRLTPSINPEIDAMLAAHPEYREQSTNEQLQHICDIIDRHIHLGYEIYERGTEFEEYIESRLALINIPNKDETFLREKLLEMYRFPELNHQKAMESGKRNK
ncbi:MAG: 1-acyl-sn-glycerol-3-phosphate acyltransferase [Paludibacteraceae bacterium]|nr:1-acyl-sn-glycerol-3-phosphate acyltransferase [Paludibacteraceae bacterium]